MKNIAKKNSLSKQDAIRPKIPSLIQRGDNNRIIIGLKSTPENNFELLKSEIKFLKEIIELKDKEHKEIIQTKNEEIKILKETIESHEKSHKRVGYTK